MRTKPSCRDQVVAILVGGVDGLRAAGCRSYLVGVDPSDPDVIWITEHWPSKEHHAASLELPEAKKAIGRAMPMLTGEFTGREVAIVGGVGAERA